MAAAVPRADGRRVAHRAAALQQRGAHGAAGDGRGARRHAVAAHQRAGRGAGAADGRSGDAGPAHAADHRPRDRGRRRGRSARRVVLRRAADAASSRTRRSRYFDTIDRMGGMVAAIERGYPQREIAESAYRFQQAVETQASRSSSASTTSSPRTRRRSARSTSTSRRASAAGAGSSELRARRDTAAGAAGARPRCRPAPGPARTPMPLLLDAARAYATVGEMCDALREVWGEYVETPVI